jgi:hypothetical protein
MTALTQDFTPGEVAAIVRALGREAQTLRAEMTRASDNISAAFTAYEWRQTARNFAWWAEARDNYRFHNDRLLAVRTAFAKLR